MEAGRRGSFCHYQASWTLRRQQMEVLFPQPRGRDAFRNARDSRTVSRDCFRQEAWEQQWYFRHLSGLRLVRIAPSPIKGKKLSIAHVAKFYSRRDFLRYRFGSCDFRIIYEPAVNAEDWHLTHANEAPMYRLLPSAQRSRVRVETGLSEHQSWQPREPLFELLPFLSLA